MLSMIRSVGDCATRVYRRCVQEFVRQGWLSLLTLVILIFGAYWLYGHLPSNFLPSMDEGSIIMDYWTPPGTSLADTNRMLDEAEKVILSLPDVASYSRRTGTQLGFFITEPNRGDYVIHLKPRGQRRPVDQVMNELRKKIGQVEPAIRTDFGQLLEDNIGDLSGGTPQPIDVKIFGEDVNQIQQKAKQVAQIVSGVPGTADVFNGIVISGPTLRIQFDPLAGARYGLTTDDLHTELNAALNGNVIGKVRVNDRTYDFRVMMTPSGLPRESLDNIKIRTPSGMLVQVRDVAKVISEPPETEIDRENLKTYVGVTGRLSGTSLGTAISDIKTKIASKIQLGQGMRIEYGGLYQQQQASFQELLWILLGGLILVSIVVLFEFADWRAPLITSLSAIAVLAGVFIALRFTGSTLNISSYVGAIMMVGIVGENAIFVIHEGRLELLQGKPPLEAWTSASHRRLRPVAMTILATALALAPLALSIGQGSQLMQQLAIAVIGGFILSGPMVLLIVPGLYRLLDPKGRLAEAKRPNT